MRAVLLDLDGVLYEGERAVAGAADAVAWIQARRLPHLFLTNTTSCPREAIDLRGFGPNLTAAFNLLLDGESYLSAAEQTGVVYR